MNHIANELGKSRSDIPTYNNESVDTLCNKHEFCSHYISNYNINAWVERRSSWFYDEDRCMECEEALERELAINSLGGEP